jgi:hypothetical protein
LKSHKPWIKQVALRKSEVEDSSSSKYVPPPIRHIKGKGNAICKNANHNSAKNVKKHSNKRSLLTCHHCGITGHICNAPDFLLDILKKKKKKRKMIYIYIYI